MQKGLHIGIADTVMYIMVSLCMVRLLVPYVELPYVFACLLFAVVAVLCMKNTVCINIVDILAVLVFLYELAVAAGSMNRCPAPVHIMMSAAALAVYVICRMCLTSVRRLKRVLLYMVIIETVILLVGLVAWLSFRGQVYASGFDSLYEFRSRFRPWGCIVNLWGSFLIAGAGNVLLAYLYCRNNGEQRLLLTVVFALLVWSGLGTFSRTVYVLYAVLFFILIALTVAGGRRYRFSWLLGVYIITVAMFCFTDRSGDVEKVVRMYGTVSQQRSVGGRIDAYTALDDIMEGRIVTGVGNGNYTLAANDFLYENDDSSFTDYAPSGYMQLFVEKGIIGIAVYGILILSVLFLLLGGVSGHKRLDALVLVFSMMLLAGKEMTFAVIEDFPGIQVMYIIPMTGILNVMQTRRSGITSIRKGKLYWTTVLAAISAVVVLCIVWDKSVEKTPDFIRRGCEYGTKYISTGNDTDLYNAISNLEQAVLRNPSDNVQRYNIAMLYLQSGSLGKASAISDFLVRECTDNALYRVGKARTQMLQGDTLAGVQEYAAALVLDPRVADDRQWEDMKKGSPELYESIKAQVAGLAIEDNYMHDPIKSAKLGKLMMEVGDYNKAESFLRNALGMLPNLGRAWYNLGLVLLRRQEYAESEKCFRKAGFLLSGDKSIKEYLHSKDPDMLQKEKEYGSFIKTRSAEYSRKFHTWYRCDTDEQLIVSVGIF